LEGVTFYVGEAHQKCSDWRFVEQAKEHFSNASENAATCNATCCFATTTTL
jgi:hypothetical protein